MLKAVGGRGCHQICWRAEKMEARLLQHAVVVLLSKRQDRAYMDVLA
jgi:hypothetical protein